MMLKHWDAEILRFVKIKGTATRADVVAYFDKDIAPGTRFDLLVPSLLTPLVRYSKSDLPAPYDIRCEQTGAYVISDYGLIALSDYAYEGG